MKNLPNVRDECAYLERRGIKVDEDPQFERTRVELQRNIGTGVDTNESSVLHSFFCFKWKGKKREIQDIIT